MAFLLSFHMCGFLDYFFCCQEDGGEKENRSVRKRPVRVNSAKYPLYIHSMENLKNLVDDILHEENIRNGDNLLIRLVIGKNRLSLELEQKDFPQIRQITEVQQKIWKDTHDILPLLDDYMIKKEIDRMSTKEDDESNKISEVLNFQGLK